MNKIALFIFLFAVAFACEPTVEEKQAMLENKFNYYIDIIKCFVNNEPLVKDVKTVIELIKSKEFEKLLPLSFQLYSDVLVVI